MHKKTVVDFKELGHQLIFENPVRILATKLIGDVDAILKKVVHKDIVLLVMSVMRLEKYLKTIFL